MDQALPGAKDYARGKWRSGGRGRGRGRGGTAGNGRQSVTDLGVAHQGRRSNSDGSDDDSSSNWAGADTGASHYHAAVGLATEETGLPPPVSQGLDLEELLQAASLQAEQSFHR
jgi:hypothetical protein